jgi:hypothetical protein
VSKTSYHCAGCAQYITYDGDDMIEHGHLRDCTSANTAENLGLSTVELARKIVAKGAFRDEDAIRVADHCLWLLDDGATP